MDVQVHTLRYEIIHLENSKSSDCAPNVDGRAVETSSARENFDAEVGMEFKTRGDAKHFLFFYGFLAGFKPAITHTFRTSNKKRNNEVTKVELKCNKHGKTKKADQQEQDNCIEHQGCEKGPKRNTNVQVKTDCRVVMVIKEHQQKWVIDRLDLNTIMISDQQTATTCLADINT